MRATREVLWALETRHVFAHLLRALEVANIANAALRWPLEKAPVGEEQAHVKAALAGSFYTKRLTFSPAKRRCLHPFLHVFLFSNFSTGNEDEANGTRLFSKVEEVNVAASAISFCGASWFTLSYFCSMCDSKLTLAGRR